MGKVTDRLKKRLVERIVLHKEFRSYSHALRRIAPAAPQTQKSLVIIPCAPDSVIGSRGDEAMIVASIQNFRRSAGTEAPVTIICSDSFSNPGWSWLQQRYNVSLSKIWNGPYPVGKVVDEVVKLQPSEIYILGADCMDGQYSPYISFELLALYTILRKKQYRISLLGFSYNNHPHRLLNRLFRKIGKDVPFNLRDSISLEHFRQHTRLPNTRLVADAAFMLVPDSKSEAASRYKTKIDALRKNGATVVLAFNLHPMLRKEQTQQELAEYARAMSSRFQELLLKHPNLGIVLLPHDDRKRISDNYMLAGMYEQLSQEFAQRVIYDSQVYRAEEIKGFLNQFDGVISSRMHLAIAALGMEVPVMTSEYQDKFRGLFSHFNYPEKYLLTPEEFSSSLFTRRVNEFIGELVELREHIHAKLTDVMELSNFNFQ